MRDLLRFIGLNTAIATTLSLVMASYMKNPRLDRLIWPWLISWVFSNSITILAWWVMPRAVPRMKGGHVWVWTQVLALLALLGFVGGTFGYLLLVTQPFARILIEYIPSMATCVVITVTVGSIIGIVERARASAQASTLEIRTRELEREKAFKAAADAKLQSLESRIHPHFLFNTLNSISSLVRSNPAEAEALIEKLAALLRFSLDRHGSLVTLADEMQITKDYLGIEKARFGDRLRYRFEIPETLLTVLVPALSVQTLVENSVKYAVGVQRQGADIIIRARALGESIELEVADTGPGFSPDSLPAGHGLDTLKQRLETLFGNATTLSTRRLDPGMEVAFRVPC